MINLFDTNKIINKKAYSETNFLRLINLSMIITFYFHINIYFSH